MTSRIAFIGLGAMGEPMAVNLVRKGFAVTVVGHRRPDPVTRLAALGAAVAPDPGEATREADAAILMLPTSREVEAVIEGPHGLAHRLPRGALVIDCSTSDPASTVRLHALLAAAGADLVDAPVTRGVQGAQQGKLAFFVGGDDAAIDRARPILDAMGDTVFRMGPAGAGHATKIINQALSYSTVALVNEALMAGAASGLDLAELQKALMAGAGSKALESFGPRIAARQYASPRVRVGDACLHLDVLQRMAGERSLPMFVNAAAQETYRLLAALGHARDDIATLAETWPREGGRGGR